MRRLGPARDPNADFDPHALGERLRGLRSERGLTLGQIAEGRFSAAFLSQIERGLARPSHANLAHIADRLDVDLDDLLSTTPREADRELTELRLTEARTAMARDEPDRALEALDGLPGSLTDRDTVDAGLLAADALIRLGRYEEGIDRLESAVGGRSLAADAILRSAEIRSRAAYRRQRYHQALEALRDAQHVVDEVGTDPMTRSRYLCARGMCQFMLGSERAAIADYENALEASGNLADLTELGRIYDGLNLAHQSLGNLAEALSYARKSAQIFEVLQNGRNVGHTHHNMGELLVKQGQHEEAIACYQRALDAFRAVDALAPQAYVLHSLAEVALQRDRLDEADRLTQDAAAIAERSGDRNAEGDVAQLRGRIAVRRQDLHAAEAHFGAAVAAFEETGSRRRLAEACYELGVLLERQGDQARALTFAMRAYQSTRDESRREWS